MMMLQRISPHTFINTTPQIPSSPGSTPPSMTTLVEQPESSPLTAIHHHHQEHHPAATLIKHSLSPESPHIHDEHYHYRKHTTSTSSRPSTPNSERNEPLHHDLTIVKRRISQDSEIEMHNPDEEDDHDSRDLKYHHHFERQVISAAPYHDNTHDEIDRRHASVEEEYARRDNVDDNELPLDLSINSSVHRRPHYQYSHHRIHDDHRRQNHDSGTDSDDSGGPGEDRGPGTAAYKKSLMKRYCKFRLI